MIEVGDKVKLLDENYTNLEIGNSYVVNSIVGNDIKILHKGILWYFKEEHLEKVDEDNNKPTLTNNVYKDNDGFITKDSGVRQKYDSGMVRDTMEGKPRYDLIYTPMLKRLAELHGRGVAKYGERNWENANSVEELIRFKGSAFRHFMQWFNNETDEDHASAVLFNINATEYLKDKGVK